MLKEFNCNVPSIEQMKILIEGSITFNVPIIRNEISKDEIIYSITYNNDQINMTLIKNNDITIMDNLIKKQINEKSNQSSS